MTSFKSKLIIFGIQNRHLFKFKLKPEVIDENTDTNLLRQQYEASAQKIGSLPSGITSTTIRIGEMTAEWVAPTNASKKKVIFYTHGGGYVSGSCADHRMHVAKLVQGTNLPVLLFDYRLAPEHPAHAAVEDSLAAYRWLLAQGIQPQNVLIAGESAGGGLAIALLVAIRDQGLPLPCAGLASSPWLDLTCSAGSFTRNARKDISTPGSWDTWNRYYVGNNDPRHPWISPIYADLHGLPPIFIQVGDHEIMLDDSVKFTQLAREAGVDASIAVWPGMVHCFAFLSPFFPEAKAAMDELCTYIRQKLPTA